jgi:hypothetical protein
VLCFRSQSTTYSRSASCRSRNSASCRVSSSRGAGDIPVVDDATVLPPPPTGSQYAWRRSWAGAGANSSGSAGNGGTGGRLCVLRSTCRPALVSCMHAVPVTGYSPDVAAACVGVVVVTGAGVRRQQCCAAAAGALAACAWLQLCHTRTLFWRLCHCHFQVDSSSSSSSSRPNLFSSALLSCLRASSRRQPSTFSLSPSQQLACCCAVQSCTRSAT